MAVLGSGPTTQEAASQWRSARATRWEGTAAIVSAPGAVALVVLAIARCAASTS